MKRILVGLVVCIFVVLCHAPHLIAKSKTKSVVSEGQLFSAKAIIIVKASTGKVLYSRNIHQRFAPASTVKILTAFVALEQLGMRAHVSVSRKAANAQPTKLCLSPGSVYDSLDLINAILISSANDASVALAEAAAGTEEEFAKKMNKKAKQLGAKNSNFTNASGLPDKNQYTTVYDLYRITKKALSQPDINSIMRKRKERIKSLGGKENALLNHNKLLFRKNYPTVLLKTGYTRSAKHCFAGKIYVNGSEYVFAFLKSSKPWKDIDAIISFIKRSKPR